MLDDFIVWWHYKLWNHCDATYRHIICCYKNSFLYLFILVFPVLIFGLALWSIICFFLCSRFLLLGFLSVIWLLNYNWFLNWKLEILLFWFNSRCLEFLNDLCLFDDFIVWWHYKLWNHCDATYRHVISCYKNSFLYLLNINVLLYLKGLNINSSNRILVIK